MKYRILFLNVCLIFANAEALTVRDALVAAYTNNQELLTLRQAIIANHEKIVQAKGGYRPKIDASLSGTLAKNKSSSDSNQYPSQNNVQSSSFSKDGKGTITVSQNIFRGLGDRATVSKAEHDILASWAQLQDKEQEIFFNVIQAYLGLYAKYATAEVYRVNLASMRQAYESAVAKRDIGEETLTQESLAEAQYDAALSKLELGLADLETARATFQQLTGLEAPEYVDHPKETVEVPVSVADLLEVALLENPKITQAVEALASAKQDKKVATGRLLPSLDLQASTTKDLNKSAQKTNGPTLTPNVNATTASVNNQVALTLSVPLYDQGVTRSQRRQASETIITNRLSIEKTRRDITQLCKQAFRTYAAAKTNRENTAKQVKAQEVAVDGVTQEMSAGAKIMQDVLTAQTQLVQAKLDHINAIQQYYVYAYQMRLLQGKLTADGLELPVEVFRPQQHYNEVKNYF